MALHLLQPATAEVPAGRYCDCLLYSCRSHYAHMQFNRIWEDNKHKSVYVHGVNMNKSFVQVRRGSQCHCCDIPDSQLLASACSE